MEMIKLIIFDLDGVLVEAKNLHFEALNKALGKEYAISWKEHLSKYDGLKTNQKLEMLTINKGLPAKLHSQIWEDKQKYTLQELRALNPNQTLQSVMSAFSEDGYKLAVCSNSVFVKQF
jgi:beta-phosphoglucomutase